MAYQLNDEDKKIARQMAQQMYRQQEAKLSAMEPKQKHAGGFLDFVLPTAGSIIGGIGGTLLAPVAGTAAGGAAGGAAGKWLSNFLQGRKDTSEGVLTEGVLGALPGAGKLIKGGMNAVRGGSAAGTAKPGMLARFGAGLEDKGYSAISSNINIAKPAATQLKPRDTMRLLSQEFGVKNIDEGADVAKAITGSDGLGTEAMRNAAYSSKGVDISNVTKAMDDQLTRDGVFVNSATRKNLGAERQNVIDQVFGGKGSLTNTAAPAEAYDLAQDYGKRAFDLGIKEDVAANQLSKVYKRGERAIKDNIFSDPTVLKELPAIKATYVTRLKEEAALRGGNQKKVLEKFAEKVNAIEDPAELSKTMAPWVKAGQIKDQMNIAENTIGGRNLFNAQGATVPGMVRNAANSPKAGNMMINIGRKLQGRSASGAAPAAADAAAQGVTRKDVLKMALQQGVPRAVLAPMLSGSEAGALDEQLDPEVLAAMTGEGVPTIGSDEEMMAMMGEGGFGAGSAEDVRGGVAKDTIDQQVINAAMSGDKEGMQMLMALSDYLYPAGGEGGDLSAAAQKGLITADVTESAVNEMEALLSKNPAQSNSLMAKIFGGVQKAAGSAGINEDAKVYGDVSKSLASSLARSIAGESGTLTDRDIERAQGMIPQLTDSAQTRKIKLDLIRKQLASSRTASRTYGAGGDGSSSLSAVMGGAY